MPRAKKKIVWLAHEANFSGANIALLEYIEALRDEYDFHIVLPYNGDMTEALYQQGIANSVILQYSWARDLRWWEWFQCLKIIVRTKIATSQTKRLIETENADFVFTNTLTPFVGALTAKHLHKQHIWWIHEFGEEDFGFRIGFGHQNLAFRKIEKWSSLIICNSEAVREKFHALMPNAKVERLYQPVSWKAVSSNQQKKLFKYLMFGQIIPSKGHKEVLNALVKIKNTGHPIAFSLHIKGPGENKIYLEELREIIYRHKLDPHVTIETGFFKKEEILPSYEVLIVASQAEAFGRVIIEANKAGLKVIVKNMGGSPELINETNGILYDDLQDLADILIGQKRVPAGPIQMNYNEQEEILKLKKWLLLIL